MSEMVNEMAYERADAIDRCASLGKLFIEHFRKICTSNDNDTKKHWAKEMQSWLDDVKDIVLKQNKKQITFSQLIDWFFTKGSSVDVIFKDDETLQDNYNEFLKNVSKDFNVSQALIDSKLLTEDRIMSEEIKYVFKAFPDGGGDYGVFPRGVEPTEENAVIILSRMNRYFPWEVYVNGEVRKDLSRKLPSDNNIKDIKEFIMSHLDEFLEEETVEESVITEAPDDDGIMSDDELDAQDQKERDEFEARLKARRDKVAQQRAERDAKVARDNELKAQAQEKAKAIGDDWSFDNLFDKLVPQSGKCDTLAGELVRAVNKIDYRWYNDGDRFFEDYGIETCGQPAYFLAMFEHEDETPFWDMFIVCGEDNKDEDEYSNWLNKLRDFVADYINTHQELLAMDTDDMYDVDRDDVENWLDENNLIPTYDIDASIPPELDAHIEAGNIDERDLRYEVESWIEDIGGNRYDSVDVSWGSVYVNGCNKNVYDELDGNLYRWLEQYAEDLTEEYGDPNEVEDEDDWAEEIASELGQDVDMVQNILDTHSFDSYEDAIEYIKELIEEEGETDEE